jgi:hypothetical protein
LFLDRGNNSSIGAPCWSDHTVRPGRLATIWSHPAMVALISALVLVLLRKPPAAETTATGQPTASASSSPTMVALPTPSTVGNPGPSGGAPQPSTGPAAEPGPTDLPNFGTSNVAVSSNGVVWAELNREGVWVAGWARGGTDIEFTDSGISGRGGLQLGLLTRVLNIHLGS